MLSLRTQLINLLLKPFFFFQVFHICDTSRKISFLCPNGTIFSQSHLICDWWFKVDCASAPALYESSAEYYSNEQKKTQKITQSLSKNPDLQQIGTDTNVRAESRRTSINVPSTTERLLRHRQRLQGDSLFSSKATARSFQALFDTTNFNPTQRTQATTAFEKRRKNLVQLIANNFGNAPLRSTSSSYTDGPIYRPTTAAPAIDYNSIREMQVAAESASFAANNNNRQFLQDYNSKNFRPYPVYTPNLPSKPNKPKPNHHLTTLYDFRDRNLEQATDKAAESTTKRSTLVPYNKPFTANHERRDPYTRPGISLLKDFLEKEKNKTVATSTEKIAHATDRSDLYEQKEDLQHKVTIETKDTYESATKIPQTTRSLNSYATDTASSERQETRTTPAVQITTEPYQERRERLIRKLNLGTYGSTTEATVPTETEKYYGDLPNRPGLIVPPSLTPKTLHSLAIYYATALDNLSTTETPDAEVTTHAFDEYEPLEEELPGLFSRHTLHKYSSLFGRGHDNSELLEDLKLDPNGTYNELAEDLSVQQSQNPLATSPQIRELAQVFTHALSAYLQDPVQFRKVLSDIRPTQPSFGDIVTTEEGYNTEPTTTVNEDDEEILGFSDDIKSRPALTSLRDAKALNIATNYPTVSEEPTTTPKPYTTEIVSSAYSTVTPRSPFRCCARISASYTTASTPISSAPSATTTPTPFTNTVAARVNSLANRFSEKLVSTTENSYAVPKYGGFHNNTSNQDSPYGTGVSPTNSQPLNEYVEVTNLPSAWGIDASDSTAAPSISTAGNTFESKKIRVTTIVPETTPVYFTETDSVELENEEELQRAHSQSFIGPQGNNLRQGKQLQFEETSTVKKPSEDLEAPTVSESVTTTAQPTTQASTTIKVEELEANTTPSPVTGDVFTSPDSEKTTNQFQWSTFEAWQSTVIDPITLNDGLSQTGLEQAQVAKQTNAWALSTTTVPSTEYSGVSEQTVSPSINVELTTPGNQEGDRFGRLLRDPTSTEPAQDLSAITDTVVEKAKEIMGGMNATTTEKLMNVMKKTKSKTVRRLILLLVQTCDDDHNTTAEASKRALLEALMAVSQKDMEEIAKEQEQSEFQTTTPDFEVRSTEYRRTDRYERQEKSHVSDRRGKSLNFDPSAINSLSNPSTTEAVRTTTEAVETTTVPVKTTQTIRRGAKKFYSRTTAPDVKVTTTALPYVDSPKAEARTAEQATDSKGTSDTRALELLRSLYTIAARWG